MDGESRVDVYIYIYIYIYIVLFPKAELEYVG